jgi:hypothetical protein
VAPSTEATSGGWSAPPLTTVGAPAPPPVTSTPSSDASARMVEALRAQQQHGPTDDRVTLADLTLVAVASATQQLAASQPHRASAVQTAATSAGGRRPHEAASKPDPETERREVEELARQVLDEVHSLVEIARERSGGQWQS